MLRYTYNVGVTGAAQVETSGILTANGTDYFEVFTYMDGGGSGKTISGTATSTHFEAFSL